MPHCAASCACSVYQHGWDRKKLPSPRWTIRTGAAARASPAVRERRGGLTAWTSQLPRGHERIVPQVVTTVPARSPTGRLSERRGVAQAGGPAGVLTEDEITGFVHDQLEAAPVDGRSVCVLVPDGTRSCPLPLLM